MIRPVLEYTCPVWHSGLTVEHRSQPYRRHVHAYFLTCLSRSTVATHSSGHTRRSGRCCFRLRPRVDDSSAHCQNRGGEWQDAIQARFNAASELRAHNAGGSRERWTTFADAALQLRHQSVRSLQRIELCSGCLERAHSTHKLRGLWWMFGDSMVEHSRVDIFDIDGWPANASQRRGSASSLTQRHRRSSHFNGTSRTCGSRFTWKTTETVTEMSIVKTATNPIVLVIITRICQISDVTYYVIYRIFNTNL